MKKSYEVLRRIILVPDCCYLEVGDILVHDPDHGGKMTIYRNQQIVRVTQHSFLGIHGLLRNRNIREITDSAPVADTTPAPGPIAQIIETARTSAENAIGDAEVLAGEAITQAIDRVAEVVEEVKRGVAELAGEAKAPELIAEAGKLPGEAADAFEESAEDVADDLKHASDEVREIAVDIETASQAVLLGLAEKLGIPGLTRKDSKVSIRAAIARKTAENARK